MGHFDYKDVTPDCGPIRYEVMYRIEINRQLLTRPEEILREVTDEELRVILTGEVADGSRAYVINIVDLEPYGLDVTFKTEDPKWRTVALKELTRRTKGKLKSKVC